MYRDDPCQILHVGFILWLTLLDMDEYMALLWQQHGPNTVLQIESSRILMVVPGAVPYQISHCWMYPLTPFPRNGQNMALYSPNMVLTWSFNLSLPESQSRCPGMLHVEFQIAGCNL